MKTASIHRLQQRIDTLAVRERLLLLITVLAGVWLLFDSLWLGPVQRQLQNAAQREQQLAAQQQAELARLGDLRQRADQDPAAELRAHIERVRRDISELDERLHERMLSFVEPQQMTRLLSDLIQGSRDLMLLSVHSEAPTRLGGDNASDARIAASIYRHGLIMELAGEYLALLDFLRQVETMPWRLFWDSLQVEVIEQDTSRRFRLRVYTLSPSDAWIGI